MIYRAAIYICVEHNRLAWDVKNLEFWLLLSE